MKLSDFTQGRDNNFNLIRIVAAFAVLITHSFALVVGTSDAEPFRRSLGMTMGSIAVDAFFVTSGFLVTASLLTRRSTIEFIWARVLRVTPALWAMLILTVFGFGAYLTSLPLQSYIANPGTYYYLLKCGTLITGVTFNLPGLFEANPYRDAVNGSLWSLPVEIKMYAILATTWIAARVFKRSRLSAFKMAIVAAAAISGVAVILNPDPSAKNQFVGLFFMFFSGAAFYVLRHHIRLSQSAFFLFVLALMASSFVDSYAFFIVFHLTIAYILFYVAFVPSGWVRKYNLVGDYSYGVYIYAFPIQQVLASVILGISVLSMILISGAITLLLAVLSWHIIERRALGLKDLYVARTKRILGRDPA